MAKYKILFEGNDESHPFVWDMFDIRSSSTFKTVSEIDLNGCYMDCGNLLCNHPALRKIVGGYLSDTGVMGMSNIPLLEEFRCDISKQVSGKQMFQGCSSLKVVEIVIEQMSEYGDMFKDCSSLESVRIISNVSGLYYLDKNMFGCGSSSCVFEYSLDGGQTWISEKD